MNALVDKEIRLLRSAYLVALLLATVPVWLLPNGNPGGTPGALAVFSFVMGALLLALTSFGREFSLGTFPLLMAQPLERKRIWRTKVGILSAAMSSLFVAWCLACGCGSYAERGQVFWQALLTIGATITVVSFVGGLWTTLLLRQMVAAFWMTILIPSAIAMLIDMNDGSDKVLLFGLGLYSVAGFWLAWWQFHRAQEVGWTGGVVAMPGWTTTERAGRGANRFRRPLTALVSKELYLHQFALLGIGLLFVFHLGAVALRGVRPEYVGNTLHSTLEGFGTVWIIVPLLVGSLSVAEERKLGTSQALMSLPVSRRFQFAIKLLLVLAIGGLLSVTLFWVAEGIGLAAGLVGDIGGVRLSADVEALWLASVMLSLGLALVGFYASTFSRHVIQALAAAMGIAVSVWLLGMVAIEAGQLFDLGLWQGPLVHLIGWPTLVGTFIWLAWRNFRCISDGSPLWRGNVLGLAVALLFVAMSTTAVYHRAWEWLTPLESAHGPARISIPVAEKSPIFHSEAGSTLATLLPGGRLWVERAVYLQGRPFFGFFLGGRWQSLGGNQFIEGSNWVAAVASPLETVALSSNGTLWASEKPVRNWPQQFGFSVLPSLREFATETDRLIALSPETNWEAVVCDNSASALLLKKDGTLWRLQRRFVSTNYTNSQTVRLGSASDWARILSVGNVTYAWKRSGECWVIRRTATQPPAPAAPLASRYGASRYGLVNQPMARPPVTRRIILEPGLVCEHVTRLDHLNFRNITQCRPVHVAVRDDGTLWAWNLWVQPETEDGEIYAEGALIQLGSDTNWLQISGGFRRLAGLKTDGSLWQWDIDNLSVNPARLSKHNDWVGVGSLWGKTVSLAADGGLWYWWNTGPGGDSDQPLLAASRKPQQIENIFGGR